MPKNDVLTYDLKGGIPLSGQILSFYATFSLTSSVYSLLFGRIMPCLPVVGVLQQMVVVLLGQMKDNTNVSLINQNMTPIMWSKSANNCCT